MENESWNKLHYFYITYAHESFFPSPQWLSEAATRYKYDSFMLQAPLLKDEFYNA